jgi:hypothetical protein
MTEAKWDGCSAIVLKRVKVDYAFDKRLTQEEMVEAIKAGNFYDADDFGIEVLEAEIVSVEDSGLEDE